MLRTPTLDKLRDLNLMGMARAFQEQTERPDYQALTFEERLGLMVDVEMEERENRRLFRYLKSARLRDNACVEDINFHTPRGLQRAQILELAECRWIGAHQNVLVTGKTGVGKTFIACALAQAAIRHGHTALYLRVPRLIDELAVARVDGRLPRLLAAWARVEVLLLDDFAMQALSNQQGADLLEVIEDRTQRRSTIVTSQLAVKHWHEMLGDPTLADAIMDRLVHHAHRIELDGPSMRDARTTQDGQSDGAGDPQRPAQGSKQAKSTVAGEKRAATTAQDAG
jgi:DNA replication protein DnaC